MSDRLPYNGTTPDGGDSSIIPLPTGVGLTLQPNLMSILGIPLVMLLGYSLRLR